MIFDFEGFDPPFRHLLPGLGIGVASIPCIASLTGRQSSADISERMLASLHLQISFR